MKFLWRYLRDYVWKIAFVMGIKLTGTLMELAIPYTLEHLIDTVAPTGQTGQVFLWGGIMVLLAAATRFFNVTANRLSVRTARNATFRIRRDLFHASLNLSGSQMDTLGLPSIISRMTSDSYNVQGFIQSSQTIGIRAPFMLLGGIMVTMSMDRGLASILCIMAPIMIVLVVFISWKGIPLYDKVQQGMDDIVRVMRENITGIRVVKALSKEGYEKERFARVNETAARRDIRASIVMSLPGPVVSLMLNTGLTLVVLVGARRVNAGQTQPGVILAFLTYFNMILMGVMGLNRIFMMMSKANASAKRIALVTDQPDELARLDEAEGAKPTQDGYLVFDHVSFNYLAGEDEGAQDSSRFAGASRQKALSDVHFSVPRGRSLGIIGATGSGKTTIVNLLMRFYDPQQGHVFVDGRDVRTYERDELHRLFGVALQTDRLFVDTIRGNIDFGRGVSDERVRAAARDAMADGFVSAYEDGYEHMAAIQGSNFSGGQRQRLLIARALAANPRILILDDSSSALDYRTDAALRKAIETHYADATTVVIAQRVSSIMGLDQILVLDEGKVIGQGNHQDLLDNCPVYRDIYHVQMGEVQ